MKIIENPQNFGWVGRICRVNLTNETVNIESTNKYFSKFIGGRGIAQWILLTELKPNVHPLDPRNIIIFSTGPLTGTLAPISGRLCVDSKNFVTGGVGSSNVGGFFGSELKYAGFDAIIIQGKSSRPVYLMIDYENIIIKDAEFLWGKTTWETEDLLEQNDKNIQVLSIGPAGENLVKSACIIVNRKHAAGRCGFGAIMGAKNLKAIAVRGRGKIKIAEPVEFIKSVDKVWGIIDKSSTINQRYRETLGTHFNTQRANDSCALPYRNFQDDHWSNEKFLKVRPKVFEKWKTRNIAEFNSPIYMSSFYKIPEEGVETEGFEQNHAWDYMGKLDMNEPIAIIKAHILCNSLGLDIDNSSGVIAWAFELYEKGILSKDDTDGLELKWGDSEVILNLIKKLAYREGIGELLAKGVLEASKIIGSPSEYYALHMKGQELAEGIRSAKGWALGIITATRGGGHLNGAPMTGLQKISPEIGMKRFGDPNVGKQNIYSGKAKAVVWYEKLKAIVDMCGLGYHSSCWISPELCDANHYAALFSTATGNKMSGDDLMLLGEKLQNVEKAFNTVHRGFLREDDLPPKRLMLEPIKSGKYKGELLDRDKVELMLDEYYELHGWDKKTSWQTRKSLEKLGMSEVINILKREGKLIEKSY